MHQIKIFMAGGMFLLAFTAISQDKHKIPPPPPPQPKMISAIKPADIQKPVPPVLKITHIPKKLPPPPPPPKEFAAIKPVGEIKSLPPIPELRAIPPVKVVPPPPPPPLPKEAE